MDYTEAEIDEALTMAELEVAEITGICITAIWKSEQGSPISRCITAVAAHHIQHGCAYAIAN